MFLLYYRGQFIVEPSFVFCEQLIEGRLSFQGMNPEIERLIELEELEKLEKLKKEEQEEEIDISDSQMARRWQNFKKINSENPSKSNYNRKWVKEDNAEPLPKRPKFMKPEDD